MINILLLLGLGVVIFFMWIAKDIDEVIGYRPWYMDDTDSESK